MAGNWTDHHADAINGKIVSGREIYTEKFMQTSRKIFYVKLIYIVHITEKTEPDVPFRAAMCRNPTRKSLKNGLCRKI